MERESESHVLDKKQNLRSVPGHLWLRTPVALLSDFFSATTRGEGAQWWPKKI
jgi:hypothetical protein